MKSRRAECRIVAVPVLELRRRPDHRSECVTECLMGSRLLVERSSLDGRWLHVLAPDGYRAWARSWGTAPSGSPWGARERACRAVRAAFSHVHAGPDADSAIVTPVAMGCRIVLAGRRAGDWRPVILPDGREGWIPEADTEVDGRGMASLFWSPPVRGMPRLGPRSFARARLRRVIERARQLIGTPYRWGGASAWGLDCSGFVRLVFGLEGIALPRDARDQASALARWLATTDRGGLRTGDLVFFGRSLEAIDHVGLVVEGGRGRVLHASGSVRLSSLDEGDPLFEPALLARVRAVARPPWSGRKKYSGSSLKTPKRREEGS